VIRIVKHILAFLFVVSHYSNAGIIDTENHSFIDDVTQLEWMDFGINNGESYNYVTSSLALGEKYEGWRLAQQKDVLNLWSNAFANEDVDSLNLNIYGQGFHRADDMIDVNGYSSLDKIFKAMGFNSHVSGNNYSWGWFEGDDGHLKAFHFYDSLTIGGIDKTYVTGENKNWDSWRNISSVYYSTMLVKNYSPVKTKAALLVAVSEPASLSLFVFGFLAIFLYYRR